jgi:membrane-anchored protein YejM (alkaline phosphatase superfamily)
MIKAASLSELKKELQTLPPAKVLELCMHLAKYKKENKEFLSYLLFEAYNEQAYIKDVKDQIDELFDGMNKSSLYLAKKTIRKILRATNKYAKYSGSKQTEAELLLFFCKTLKKSGVPIHTSTALSNLYQGQIQKINKALATLHEDLQHDYAEELKTLL